jgi:hypothetical protein
VTAPERATEAAEAVRALNHETIHFTVGYPPDGEALPEGYTWPSDVYATLGQLETMLQRTPQALRQAATWLGAQYGAGFVGHDGGIPATGAVAEILDYLDQATAQITGAAAALALAHGVAAHLTGVDPEATS